NEFRALTAEHFLGAMRGKLLVDLRNIYNPGEMRDAGLIYHSIGRE
ncbi:MAG: UDP-glucose 6-dehydrogenase, partial [SAR116 cluster bacterium MED-G06]